MNLGGDQVEDSLALEHVEVCLHLLKVGEALVLQEGVDSNQHLLEDLPRFAQPRVGKIFLHSNLVHSMSRIQDKFLFIVLRLRNKIIPQ